MTTRAYRRLLPLLLSIAILALFACSGSGGEEAADRKNEEPEDEVLLRFYFSGDKKAATDEVWAAVGDYVQSKGLHVRFDVHFIPIGDYRDKMMVKSAAGDRWDMNFDADWLSYKQMAAKGAYMTLNDLLPEYAPHLYEKYKQQGTLRAAEVDGKVTGLPWTMKMNQRFYAQWRSDLTKKAGLNPAPGSIRTIEDVDAFLRALKKAYPNAKLSRTLPRDLYKLRDEWVDLGFHGMGFYLNDPKVRIQPVEQQPFYLEAAIMAKKWYDAGILNKDIPLDKEDGASLWRNGNMLFTAQSHEWVNADPGFSDPSFEQESSLLYPDRKVVNRTPLANVIAINRNSEHPDLVLRFLDMLETDGTLYDLVQYGIEGKTYLKQPDGSVAYPAGMGTTTSNYMEWGGQWGLWKPQFMRPTPTYGKGFWLAEEAFANEPNNVNSPIDGLFISEDRIRDELILRDRNVETYVGAIELGTVPDPVQAIADYVRLQQDSGLDKILAEAQRQIDEYLARKRALTAPVATPPR
ncbi:extracellular solute-binding protein [Cohnella nanjingensis]|uniref:Extracellular solute-binding protein n=1 Tax=Cohnella nanjingensis TaxID=1387779 RepID=A0A7X0VFT9_9BACL|nr:extracellular solute-binding protein [Cohnella nanjingensis]MBB6670974.1 extracellular solute-binding protein [Cohnella nanjingensis]